MFELNNLLEHWHICFDRVSIYPIFHRSAELDAGLVRDQKWFLAWHPNDWALATLNDFAHAHCNWAVFEQKAFRIRSQNGALHADGFIHEDWASTSGKSRR